MRADGDQHDGNASHAPAREHSTATISSTRVSATTSTARTAAARTGSGIRGFAYMTFHSPFTAPVTHTRHPNVSCATVGGDVAVILGQLGRTVAPEPGIRPPYRLYELLIRQ